MCAVTVVEAGKDWCTAKALGVVGPLQKVDTLTVRPQMAGRPFEEQPHDLYRK